MQYEIHMKSLSIPLAILSLLVLSGCGGDESDFAGGNSVSSISSFDGTWSNGCQFNQTTGIAEDLSLTISGNTANIDVNTYETSDCSDIANGTISSQFDLTYPGQIALSDCLNAQQVDSTIQFPIIFNDVEFSEDQFNALPASTRDDFSPLQNFDLMCVNSEGTMLFLGDTTSGQGTTDSTRPTRAALSLGINRIR